MQQGVIKFTISLLYVSPVSSSIHPYIHLSIQLTVNSSILHSSFHLHTIYSIIHAFLYFSTHTSTHLSISLFTLLSLLIYPSKVHVPIHILNLVTYPNNSRHLRYKESYIKLTSNKKKEKLDFFFQLEN